MPEREPLSISVVIPSYRRPELLERCLARLGAQTELPREALVVHRADDAETARVARSAPGFVSTVAVTGSGVVHALIAGIQASEHSIVAFTDDDGEPREDWIERLSRHFDDPSVGAVGGRDIVTTETQTDRLTTDVGRVTAWGKLVGNHHLATGGVRDVSVLKGVNMAFRRSALAIPRGLRGEGAQVHHELATCLCALSQGWRLVLDPAIVVDHLPGPRFDAEGRGEPGSQAISDASYNMVMALLSLRPELFFRRAVYGLLIGDRNSPGLVRAAAAVVRGEPMVPAWLLPSVSGQLKALMDVGCGRRLEMVSFCGGVDRAPKATSGGVV